MNKIAVRIVISLTIIAGVVLLQALRRSAAQDADENVRTAAGEALERLR